MKIAVVNLFDPLPGERFRSGRYGTLCLELVGAGHQVRWYSSAFWHEFKKPRDTATIHAAAERLGYRVILSPAPGYRRNVSLARLRDHAVVARHLRRLWREEGDRPDVVLASLPPPALARAAADWADGVGARLVVDVQDLWPGTFRRFWPTGLGWLNPIIFMGTARAAREVYRRAAALTGVARGYVDHARPFLAPGTPVEVLHLGVDLEAFDAGVAPVESFGLTKPAGRKWLFFGGAVRSSIDAAGMAAMMADLRNRGRDNVELVVVAPPPTDEPLRLEAARRGLENICFLGQRPYDQYASIAAVSDAAVLPQRPEALVFFPNRAYDYLAAGLPMLNTAPGEVADLLAAHDAGLTCDADAPATWADAVERLLASDLPADHRERRGTWVGRFDRTRIARRFVKFLEQIDDDSFGNRPVAEIDEPGPDAAPGPRDDLR